MLSEKDEKVLQEIISSGGNCMTSNRCPECPFRSMCLPEFLNPVPPSSRQRFDMAMDVITHNALIDSFSDIENFKGDFRGITKER